MGKALEGHLELAAVANSSMAAPALLGKWERVCDSGTFSAPTASILMQHVWRGTM